MKNKKTIKELFFDYPTKQWHFEQLLKEAGLSRAQTNAWIKKIMKDNLIKRVKPKSKMPYYIAKYDSPEYISAKKLFALEKFHSSGFLSHLLSLQQAEAIIIFGSIIRGDWHKESDIDLFVYGNADDLELGKYWIKLGREIQFFGCKDKKELKKYNPALLKNILKGYTIKGSIPDLEVKISA
ncbi:MAG: nucleotidyltransferase domain-containing protein [Nanoarchaeota archaeon]|nr:nucleotidyltransferase domain-containing protein [Nanoarchaeota archaeon]MBU1632858.1 nucleotidyltransferase domain-containing protein [Nanoarchaeota archaeon]MBU1876664.1 nucleotidyltransferase domain-containing protein [Nanoarchaeota archaeon]